MEAIPRPTDSPSVRALIERLYAAFDEPNDLETNPRAAPGREAIVAKAVAHGRRDLPPGNDNGVTTKASAVMQIDLSPISMVAASERGASTGFAKYGRNRDSISL